MKINFQQLIEGYKNKLIPSKELKENIKIVSDQRKEICVACEHYSENIKEKKGILNNLRPDIHCDHCGCNIDAKTKCLSCKCPTDKWKAFVDDNQEDEINQILKDDEQEEGTT